MSRFIFIDHSLKRIGGHHFDYAFHLLAAAEQAGFDVVLAIHRRFCKSNEQLPKAWKIHPVFRYDTYQPETVFENGNRSNRWRHRRKRAAVIASFARSCRRLFRREGLGNGDHVFLPTMSELDLLGLAKFLNSNRQSLEVDWHLQFHYNIFEGRNPEFVQQHERLQAVKKQFEYALEMVPKHRLHFYNTSEQLTDQYNLLGVAQFESLAYPINPRFTQPHIPKQHVRPLRITCAGAIRAEKGHSRLNKLVQSLWQGCLADGKAQLVVQSKKAHGRDLPRLQLAIPGERKTKANFSSPADTGGRAPVVYVRQPLSTPDYVDFIRAADIGLMLYDSKRYFARRAGVLGEFLAAGIPVIVPAGCWLAEQIAEPVFRQLDGLAQALPIAESYKLPDQSFGDASNPAVEDLTIPPLSRELLVSFRFDPSQTAGRYARLQAFQLDSSGCLVHRAVQTVGHRNAGGVSRSLFHLHPNAAQVRLNWRNAYHHERLRVINVEAVFHAYGNGNLRPYPSGAVGLIAAEPDEVPGLVREMVANYGHYRTTAAEFSREWFARHDPRETVAQLTRKRSDGNTLQVASEAA